MIVLRGGRVLTSKGWENTDVTIADSKIVAIDAATDFDARVIDASGCLVGPGFVDLHTHLREPGQTWKEDLDTGAAAAAAGGYTAVVAMPNTDPPIDSPKLVRKMTDRAREVRSVEVVASGALTERREGLVPADIVGMYDEGVRIFSDDGDCVVDANVFATLAGTLARLEGTILAQHAEDHAQTADGHMHHGEMSRRLGVAGLSSEAETAIVERDIGLIAGRGVHYHCQHVSAARTVDVIREAKRAGLAVTAEVTPHHLVFDESSLAGLDPDFKMYPPLRASSDREALVEGLIDGTIDAVATDHAPHAPAEKSVPFDEAPRGVTGLETAASAVWSVVGDPDRFFAVMSTAPAAIAGLQAHGRPIAVGGPANLVVFDPDAPTPYENFLSKSTNTPFRGMTLPGSVVATMRDGEITFQTGEARK